MFGDILGGPDFSSLCVPTLFNLKTQKLSQTIGKQSIWERVHYSNPMSKGCERVLQTVKCHATSPFSPLLLLPRPEQWFVGSLKPSHSTEKVHQVSNDYPYSDEEQWTLEPELRREKGISPSECCLRIIFFRQNPQVLFWVMMNLNDLENKLPPETCWLKNSIPAQLEYCQHFPVLNNVSTI